jgi:hypothetical protein
MSNETLEGDVLSRVSTERREFIKKYLLGPAFAAPLVVSFLMRNPAGAHAQTFCSNSTPVVPTSRAQCKNGGWRTFARPDCSPFKNQGDCISFVATGK